MVKRWILYLGALIGCAVFYCAYQLWFSWFALVGMLCLPVVSLAVSLPAMTRVRLEVSCPAVAAPGAEVPAGFGILCPVPHSPVRCRLGVTRTVTGESWLLKEGQPLPTDHCGQLVCRPEKAAVYDYLGLFRLRAPRQVPAVVTVRPKPVPIEELPSLARQMGSAWRPKPGGGFSEHHEIRLYQPGDKLNQVHWKLSAKTGKLMLREAMEPAASRVCVELILRGTPRELDRSFGQLFWLCGYLLEKGIRHEVRALTGNGVVTLPVTEEKELLHALDALLAAPPAPENGELEAVSASWQYRIGGGRA